MIVGASSFIEDPHRVRINDRNAGCVFRVGRVLRLVFCGNGLRVCGDGYHGYDALDVGAVAGFDDLVRYCECETTAGGSAYCEDLGLISAEGGGVVPGLGFGC